MKTTHNSESRKQAVVDAGKRHTPGWWKTLLLCTALFGLMSAGIAGGPVVIAVDVSQPGIEISEDALGLSYETSLMLPDKNGVHYFRKDNKPLVTLFRTLGIKSLRIGGNSVDDPKVPIPSEADVRAFFEFAKAARVKVIYSVRLQDGDPESAARFAKLIHDHYSDTLDCFAIGNEPGYYKDYEVYSAKWKAIRDAIVQVYPEAVFCGPDQNPKPELISRMVKDFGNEAGRLVQITQHSYSFGCSYKNPSDGMKDVNLLVPFDPAEAREKMLSPSAYEIYEKILKGMVEAVEGTDVTYRMTEVNSFWFSGLKGASDSYASALWALDYLHWWTSHGADGLNFHTGDRTGGSVNLPCRYAAFVSLEEGYKVRPLGYGLKLFDLGGKGKVLPVTLSGVTNEHLAAYASLDDKTVLVTLINKAHGSDATDLNVQIRLDGVKRVSKAQAMLLTAKGGDIAAGSANVTLGGAAIHESGRWKGDWSKLPVWGDKETSIILPPASAAVIEVRIR